MGLRMPGRFRSGFTLIELLVVIAIIGILASIVLASVNAARIKAHDARRISDLKAIQNALELYATVHGKYPPELWACDSSVGASASICPVSSPGDSWASNSDLQVLVTERDIPALPVDPVNDATYHYEYEPDAAGQGTPPCGYTSCRYQLRAFMESNSQWYYVRNPS